MKVKEYDVELTSQRPKLVVKETYEYGSKKETINSPDEIARFCRSAMRLHMKAEEYVYIFGMNTKGKVLGVCEVAKGDSNFCYFPIKSLLVRLLLMGSSSAILVHNHPSAEVTPSKADAEVTEMIKKACKTVGIELLDHVIVGGRKYYSFNEN